MNAIQFNIIRFSYGLILLTHGLMKVIVSGMNNVYNFFESIGIYGFLAYPVTFAEIILGAFIIFGFKTRESSALTIPIMIGALMVHAGNGFVFSNKGGGWEYPLLLVIIAIVISINTTSKSNN